MATCRRSWRSRRSRRRPTSSCSRSGCRRSQRRTCAMALLGADVLRDEPIHAEVADLAGDLLEVDGRAAQMCVDSNHETDAQDCLYRKAGVDVAVGPTWQVLAEDLLHRSQRRSEALVVEAAGG